MADSGSAPSINMHFNDSDDGTIIMHDVKVPADGSTINTYYCTLQWNGGQEGGGYCGIQNSPAGHNAIFSIWDPVAVHEPIQVVKLGHGTVATKFGGEGTGMKTMNNGYGWGEDRWYTPVVRAWQYNNHTYFGFWIHDQSEQTWFHHATLDYPVPNVVFKGSTNCFIEDWISNGEYGRSVYYKDGYKYSTSDEWIPFKIGSFSVHGGSSHADNYDVRVAGSVFWLASGGSFDPSVDKNGSLSASEMAPSPSQPPINFSITSASHTHVSWNVPDSSTPQFYYEVKIDGQIVSSGWNSEVRNVYFKHQNGSNLELKLEDILGRTTTEAILV